MDGSVRGAVRAGESPPQASVGDVYMDVRIKAYQAFDLISELLGHVTIYLMYIQD